MKARITAAVVLAVALAVAASTASGSTRHSTKKAAANEVVVWVMTDAENGWPGALAAANNAFKAQHPGVDVNIQYQSWDSLLQKFDASLAANSAPDVIELGNTQTTSYMAAGALAADQGGELPELEDVARWPQGLAVATRASSTASRTTREHASVIYRKDMLSSRRGQEDPDQYSQFLSAGSKLMKKFGKNPNFSAFYEPGQNWYVMLAVRLGLGRRHRRVQERQVDGRLRLAEGVQASLPSSRWCASSPAPRRRTTRRTRSRPSRSPRPRGRVRRPTAGSSAVRARPEGRQRRSLRGRSWAPSRCRATSRAGPCRPSSAAPTSRSRSRPAPEPRRRLDHGVHRHRLAEGHRQGRQHRRTRPRSLNVDKSTSGARAVREGGEVQTWFVPTAPNWVNVEKRATCSGHAHDHPDQQGKRQVGGAQVTASRSRRS